MALLNELHAAIDWMGWYILPFIFIMSVIVFFHELGHYLVGRWSGVKIEAFSLGFGPELYARVDKLGTRWRVAAFPLGGYVKFYGDANAASAPDLAGVEAMSPDERTHTLAGQPLRNRAAIVAAGPIANFVLAFVIFTALFMAFGRVEHSARIGAVEAGSAAAQAGFEAGDVVKSIDGAPVETFQDLQQATMLSTGLPMSFVVDRAGHEVKLTATPEIAVVDQGPLGKRRMGHLGLASSRRKDAVFAKRGIDVAVGNRNWRGRHEESLGKAFGTLSHPESPPRQEFRMGTELSGVEKASAQTLSGGTGARQVTQSSANLPRFC